MIKNRIESFAKYAGIATVCVEWLALLLYYIQMPSYFGGQYPISYYASLPQTKLVFTICYTLAAIFFWTFIRHHLHKFYPAPIKLFTWSMLLFVALAVFPYNPNNPVSDMIHSLFGYSSSVFFAVGMVIMAKNAHDNVVSRVTLVSLVVSFLLLLGFIFSSKDSHLVFAFEAGSWLVWQIWCLWMTYYSYKRTIFV